MFFVPSEGGGWGGGGKKLYYWGKKGWKIPGLGGGFKKF